MLLEQLITCTRAVYNVHMSLCFFIEASPVYDDTKSPFGSPSKQELTLSDLFQKFDSFQCLSKAWFSDCPDVNFVAINTTWSNILRECS